MRQLTGSAAGALALAGGTRRRSYSLRQWDRWRVGLGRGAEGRWALGCHGAVGRCAARPRAGDLWSSLPVRLLAGRARPAQRLPLTHSARVQHVPGLPSASRPPPPTTTPPT